MTFGGFYIGKIICKTLHEIERREMLGGDYANGLSADTLIPLSERGSLTHETEGTHGVIFSGWEFLAGPSLRGLQGIQFSVTLCLRGLQVSGHAAGADPPLDRGVREAYAVFAGWELFGFLATFTLLDNRVAVTSVKLTPLLAHKKAVNTFFYRCTNHGYHILSSRLLINQRSHQNRVRALVILCPTPSPMSREMFHKN